MAYKAFRPTGVTAGTLDDIGPKNEKNHLTICTIVYIIKDVGNLCCRGIFGMVFSII
jgi:hypothetical protein